MGVRNLVYQVTRKVLPLPSTVQCRSLVRTTMLPEKIVTGVIPPPPGTPLPYYAVGEVVHGFGRGSKEIGCPTANYHMSVVDALPPTFATGIYFGWASVDQGDVHKMVMSVGWNPFYKDQKKSMETHIMHEFPEDFYGSQLRVVVVGYLRPEMDFKSLDALIAAIQGDIRDAEQSLDLPEFSLHQNDPFFLGGNAPTDFRSRLNCNESGDSPSSTMNS